MFTRKLGLFAVAVLLSIGFSELIVRILIGPPVVWRFPQEQYVSDPVRIYALKPLQQAFTHDKPVSVSSLGLRDREFPARTDPGVTRILALGDSQTFGNGLELRDTWPKQLEALLNAQCEGLWEVVNAGVPASNTFHQSRQLRFLSEAIEWDVVLVGLYVNDIGPAQQSAPFSVEGRTDLRYRLGYMLKRSALFTALWQARGAVSILLGRDTVHPEFEMATLTGDPYPAIDEGWQQVDESLGEIGHQAAARGAGVMVVILPRRDQVSGILPQTAYNDRARELAEKHGLVVVDVLPDLKQAYAIHRGELFIPWDGHHSSVANERIARAVAPGLCTAHSDAPDHRASPPTHEDDEGVDHRSAPGQRAGSNAELSNDS